MNITIGTVFMYLGIYVLLHILIGLKLEKLKKDIKENPGNNKIMTTGRKINNLFKWFPAIYLIFILILFYFF